VLLELELLLEFLLEFLLELEYLEEVLGVHRSLLPPGLAKRRRLVSLLILAVS